MVPISISAVQLTVEFQEGCGPTIKEFKAKVDGDISAQEKIKTLKGKVEEFAVTFPLPGFDNW